MPQPLVRIVDQLKREPSRTGSIVITVFGDAIVPRGGSVWLGTLLEFFAALDIDATSQLFGWAPKLRLDGDLAEYICAVLGAVLVLVVGSIWRRQHLHHLDQVVVPVTAEAVPPVEPG